MFNRKFKSDYIGKKYTGFEEGNNLAVDIVLPPKNELLKEMFTIWFLVSVLGSFALGVYSTILGIICALIVFYNAIEKIDIIEE